MKKPSCRRNDKEKQQHAEAVRIRKMTDEQICAYIDQVRAEGANPDAQEGPVGPQEVIIAFIDSLDVNGIGKVTIKKLRQAAQEL